VNRKSILKFQPQTVIKELEIKNVPKEEIRDKLVNDYLEVGHL
jgi:hypothetical protein